MMVEGANKGTSTGKWNNSNMIFFESFISYKNENFENNEHFESHPINIRMVDQKLIYDFYNPKSRVYFDQPFM